MHHNKTGCRWQRGVKLGLWGDVRCMTALPPKAEVHPRSLLCRKVPRSGHCSRDQRCRGKVQSTGKFAANRLWEATMKSYRRRRLLPRSAGAAVLKGFVSDLFGEIIELGSQDVFGRGPARSCAHFHPPQSRRSPHTVQQAQPRCERARRTPQARLGCRRQGGLLCSA